MKHFCRKFKLLLFKYMTNIFQNFDTISFFLCFHLKLMSEKKMVTFCQSVWYFVYFLPTWFSPVQVYLKCNKHLYLYICILIKTWNTLSGAKPTCELIRYFTDRFIISKYIAKINYFFFQVILSFLHFGHFFNCYLEPYFVCKISLKLYSFW